MNPNEGHYIIPGAAPIEHENYLPYFILAVIVGLSILVVFSYLEVKRMRHDLMLKALERGCLVVE